MGTKADKSEDLVGQGKENMNENPQRRGRLETKAKGPEMRGSSVHVSKLCWF